MSHYYEIEEAALYVIVIVIAFTVIMAIIDDLKGRRG